MDSARFELWEIHEKRGNMKGLCAIISGGEYSEFDGIEKANFIITCDRGYEYAKKNNIIPDLFIGDFDSYKGEVPDGIEIIKLPTRKDDSDTMTAVRFAVEKKFEDIVIYCALGGRLDHLFANIQSAAFAAGHGITVKIFSRDNIIFAVSDSEIEVHPRAGYSLSVFSYTDICEGVSIEGAKYRLNKMRLENTFPIGLSNEWTEEKETDSLKDVHISVVKGILLIILSKKPAEDAYGQ